MPLAMTRTRPRKCRERFLFLLITRHAYDFTDMSRRVLQPSLPPDCLLFLLETHGGRGREKNI